MNRFLALTRTRAGWCLSLLLTEFILNGAQPPDVRPGVATSSSDQAATHLSLLQAQAIAFQRNWDLLAAQSGIDSATAQLTVAKEFPNPALSWSTMKIDPRGNGTPLGNGLWDRSYDTIVAIN